MPSRLDEAGRAAFSVTWGPGQLTEAQVELNRLYLEQLGFDDPHWLTMQAAIWMQEDALPPW